MSKEELVHPIFIMLFIGLGTIGFLNFELHEFWKKDLHEILQAILMSFGSYLILSGLNTSKVVALKSNCIVKGIYCMPFGFLKVKERIQLLDLKEISLTQNERLFYEITAKSENGNPLIIKAIPNRIPAERELDIIKDKIHIATKEVRINQ